VLNPSYLRADELTMILFATEETKALEVNAVSGNDSAIDLDWKASIQGYYLHREDAYCRTVEVLVALIANSVIVSHRTKWR
jgi:hypothetical protein